MTAEHEARGWLREHGAASVEHPGGTLYAHLGRVHDRLAGHGLGTEVQLAGLMHAVYGTDGFDVALLDRDHRAVLRDIVGADAERQVYLYGACDRGRTWRELARTYEVHDRFTGRVERLGWAELRSFADLSIVNELDVAEQSPEILDKHGDYFRDVFGSWAPIASPQIVADAERVLLYQVPLRRSRHGRPSGS